MPKLFCASFWRPCCYGNCIHVCCMRWRVETIFCKLLVMNCRWYIQKFSRLHLGLPVELALVVFCRPVLLAEQPNRSAQNVVCSPCISVDGFIQGTLFTLRLWPFYVSVYESFTAYLGQFHGMNSQTRPELLLIIHVVSVLDLFTLLAPSIGKVSFKPLN